MRVAIAQLDHAEPATQRRGFASLTTSLGEPAVWASARTELAREELERAATLLAPYLGDTRAGVRELALDAMARLQEGTGGNLPAAARDHARAYTAQLLEQRDLGRWEADNRAVMLAGTLSLLAADPVDPDTLTLARRVVADPELQRQAGDRDALGWAAAGSVLEQAQGLAVGG